MHLWDQKVYYSYRWVLVSYLRAQVKISNVEIHIELLR